MKLSRFYDVRRKRRCPHGNIAKSRDQLPEIKAPVESITKLGKIAVKMSVADCMKGAAQRVLDVADESVDPIEFGDFDALRSASGDNHAMIMTSVFNGVEAAQPIGDYVSTRRQMARRPLTNGS